MEILSNKYKVITPLILVRHGRAWLELYEHAISGKDTAAFFPGFYCLFSAVEMYLKAYIILTESVYSNPDKLQSLGHDFNKMYAQLKLTAPTDFARKVKINLKKYHLFDLNIADLKYTEISQFWSVNQGLEKGQHTFAEIFDTIDKDVKAGISSWFNTVFPRKTDIVIFLQEDAQVKDVSHEQAKEWLALCPICRPKGILLSLHVSYPWGVESSPLQRCVKCGAEYRPNKDISPAFFERRI